jgi:hypothetical protein
MGSLTVGDQIVLSARIWSHEGHGRSEPERVTEGDLKQLSPKRRKLACFLLSLPRRTAMYDTQEGAVDNVSLILRPDDRTLR